MSRTHIARYLVGVILLGFFVPVFAHALTFGKTNATGSLTDGLVGWWTFDGKELVSGVVTDRSGQGNNGNPSNIATSTFFSIGRIGGGGVFDGIDDVVRIPHNSSLSFSRTSPFSISTWIKMSSKNPGTGNWFGIVGKEPVPGYYLAVVSDAGGGENSNSLGFEVSGVTETIRVESPVNSIKLNQWYHVVATYDGTSLASGMKLYINNVSQTKSVLNDSLVSESTTNTNPLFIGQDGNGGYMNGTIDDVRIYNRVITTNEIRQLYNAGGSVAINKTVANGSSLTTGLLAWYTFDGKDTLNGTITDRSGQGNKGGAQNIATTTFYSRGVLGQGVLFDGVNDKINIGTDFIGTSAATICLWIKPRTNNSDSYILSNGKTIFGLSVGGRLFLNSDGSTASVSATNAFKLNVWTYACVTRTSAGTDNFYINATLSGTANQSSGTPAAGATLMTIGNRQASDIPFDGALDDLRVYNRVLSTTELMQLYEMGAANVNATSNRAPNIQNGLVGWWTFDGKDTLTGSILDKSGTGNNGAPTNIATSTFYSLGRIGQAGNFDGVNDYVSVNHSSSISFDTTNPFSYSAWVKFNLPYTPTGGSHAILGKYDTVTNRGQALGVTNTSAPSVNANALLFFHRSGLSDGIAAQTATSTIQSNVWQHVVVTYSGNSSLSGVKFYINGVSSPTILYSGLSTVTGTTVNAKAVRIGDDWTSDFAQGGIDDVRIYNRALTQSEVTQLYNMGR